MDLQTALSKIHGPVGMSSLIAGVLGEGTASLERKRPDGSSLEEAEARLAAVREAQHNCGSDYAYWGYEGEASAWQAAVNILKAAEIVGDDNLADIEYSPGGGVVMDECSKLTRWSTAILEYAESTRRVAAANQKARDELSA